jgi:hypothetical protein
VPVIIKRRKTSISDFDISAIHTLLHGRKLRDKEQQYFNGYEYRNKTFYHSPPVYDVQLASLGQGVGSTDKEIVTVSTSTSINNDSLRQQQWIHVKDIYAQMGLKDDKTSTKSHIATLKAKAALTESKWSHCNFDRCSNSNIDHAHDPSYTNHPASGEYLQKMSSKELSYWDAMGRSSEDLMMSPTDRTDYDPDPISAD